MELLAALHLVLLGTMLTDRYCGGVTIRCGWYLPRLAEVHEVVTARLWLRSTSFDWPSALLIGGCVRLLVEMRVIVDVHRRQQLARLLAPLHTRHYQKRRGVNRMEAMPVTHTERQQRRTVCANIKCGREKQRQQQQQHDTSQRVHVSQQDEFSTAYLAACVMWARGDVCC